MGLMQRAFETYCAMEEKYAGQYSAEKRDPLAPVGHILAFAELEITLDMDGNFVAASEISKAEGKILIPVTEESAGRTSAPCAHPLCEQLGYLAPNDEKKYTLYITQMENWCGSADTHPKLQPILSYVKRGTILRDLQRCGLVTLDEDGKPEKEKTLVRWRVLDDSTTPECWKDPSLFQAFRQYYAAEQGGARALCMVTGKNLPTAKQHAKGIVALNGNAKLISANDSSGFTYRGRFLDDRQAVTVSYDASQKAHNALRWLVANQSRTYGGRTFLCWNPQGKTVRNPENSFLRGAGKTYHTASDYRNALNSEILGLRTELPDDAAVVLAVFDAATTGRLALTCYSETVAADFLRRLRDWDAVCCWPNGGFGIQAPSLLTLVNCTFGTQRELKGRPTFVADDRVLAQQMQRLISCKVNGGAMPRDMVTALVNRSSMPQAYEPGPWRRLLHTACAAIQKYHAPKMGGELMMEWSFDRVDRSFQFGRLLAVMERAENDYYRSSGDDRMTNAIKAMAQFRQTPWTVFERVNGVLETAYLPRCEKWARDRYHRLCGEIVGILSAWDRDELNRPLSEFYLMGYTLQRNAFFRHKEQNEQTETEE